MMSLAIALYGMALIAQIFTAGFAVQLYLRAKFYRLGFGLLALGLALMIGRRIYPLLNLAYGGNYNLVDATLSALITICLLLGIFQIQKILIDLEEKNSELITLSRFDSLTGALNRSETFSRAVIEIDRCFRTGHKISFLMLDIDHFKKVNDQYGHPVGDLVLMDLVKHCHEQLRAIDIFGRVGGEEFFVVLPESDEAEARLVAERLRSAVASNPIQLSQDKVSITISLGVATYNPGLRVNSDPLVILKEFYKMSDDAMYRAKSAGRNRVEV